MGHGILETEGRAEHARQIVTIELADREDRSDDGDTRNENQCRSGT